MKNIIWKSIKFIVVVVVVLIVLAILIQRVFDNNISLGGYRLFTIVTGSMEPEYKVLDIIISREKEIEEIVVGDDIVYVGKEGNVEDKIITHRIIRIEENDEKEFYTQGIANTGEDPVVYEDQIYGVVVRKSVVLSFISRLVSSPIGFILLIVIPGSILIGEEVMQRFFKKEE